MFLSKGATGKNRVGDVYAENENNYVEYSFA
jgi:hypothetical protein